MAFGVIKLHGAKDELAHIEVGPIFPMVRIAAGMVLADEREIVVGFTLP